MQEIVDEIVGLALARAIAAAGCSMRVALMVVQIPVMRASDSEARFNVTIYVLSWRSECDQQILASGHPLGRDLLEAIASGFAIIIPVAGPA